MAKFKNIDKGPRGINTVNGLIFLNPGEERDDLNVSDDELASASNTGWFEIDGKADPLDHDGDGKKGGAKFPGLTNKTKAELLEIASNEEASDVSDDMTVEDIKSAIELKREEAAKA